MHYRGSRHDQARTPQDRPGFDKSVGITATRPDRNQVLGSDTMRDLVREGSTKAAAKASRA